MTACRADIGADIVAVIVEQCISQCLIVDATSQRKCKHLENYGNIKKTMETCTDCVFSPIHIYCKYLRSRANMPFLGQITSLI